MFLMYMLLQLFVFRRWLEKKLNTSEEIILKEI